MRTRGLIKTKISEVVYKLYSVEAANFVVEHPDNVKHGDYATNIAMTLPKIVNQSPMEIAKNITYKISENGFTTQVNGKEIKIVESVEIAQPGFINFFLSEKWLKIVLQDIYTEHENYGVQDIGGGSIVLIEYSQPNPNKPQHIGHARNNFLGSSLSAIYKFLNYSAVEANYMNAYVHKERQERGTEN